MVMLAVAGPAVMVKNSVSSIVTQFTTSNRMQLESGILENDNLLVI